MIENNAGSFPATTELAGEIVAAYVSNNSVPVSELPNLIQSVHSAILGLSSGHGTGGTALTDEVEKPTAAQIRKSVTRDALISFIDGRPYKTLKRHLTKHGLDPVSYRERYGLPSDYPMVSPAYSEKRSNLAKSIGLGQLRGDDAQAFDAGSKPKDRRRAA